MGSHEVERKTVANQEHLELLRKGADAWNCWRDEHPEVMPDLRGVDLRGNHLSRFNLSQADLRGAKIVGDDDRDEPDEDGYGKLEGYNSSNADFWRANLRGANLSGLSFSNLGSPESEENLKSVDLRGADLTGANLRDCSLSGAKLGDLIIESDNWHLAEFRIEPYRREQTIIPIKLKGVDLSGACLDGVDLENLDLSGANLSKANLFGANLRFANLSSANLSSANLTTTQALATNFTGVNFTGACLEDWHINSETKLDDVICEYFYWKRNEKERCPSSGSFKAGDFTLLFQKALETVDLIFADGIDWNAFFQSFQELREQFSEENLSVQAIEKKSGGAFIIRLEVLAGADKVAIESRFKEGYEMRLQFQEELHREKLQAKDRRILVYREQLEFQRQNNTSLMEIMKTMAEKDNQTTIHATNVGFINSGSGTVSKFTQNIGNNLDDITKLINTLRETAQALPEAQREETLGHLGDLEDDLKQPNDRTPRRIKATLAALLAIAGIVAASTDFSNNVLEISNKLGIELIQPHKQQLPPSGE